MSLSASCTLHMVSFVTDFRRFENSLNPIVHQICIWYYYTQVNFLPTTFRLRYHENVILKHRHKVKINNVAQMNISHDFVWVSSLIPFSCWTKSWYSKWTICVLRLEYAGFFCWHWNHTNQQFFMWMNAIRIKTFLLAVDSHCFSPINPLLCLYALSLHSLATVCQPFWPKTKLVSHFIRCNFT